MMRSSLLLSLSLLLITACGPTIGEARLVHATARPADCELKFLKLEIKDVAPDGKWELLGHVVLSQEGVRDPLDPKYRAEVRPRACALGGEGVAVLQTATAQPWALSAGGTTIDYGVVRRRRIAKATKPQRF